MMFQSTTPLVILTLCHLFVKFTAASTNAAKTTEEGAIIGAFSCAGKVIGGYYADIYQNCQAFHVCTIGENDIIRDIVFKCLPGTVFDQETRVCERQEEVDCTQSESFYYLNNALYGPGIIPASAMDTVEASTPTQQQVLDPSDALKGVVATPPDDVSQQPTPPPTTVEDTPAPQTTTTTTTTTASTTTTQQTTKLTPHEEALLNNRPEPDILKAKPTPSSHIPSKSTPRDRSKTDSSLPFTVTRTASSSSVSASARVHIETPFSRFSLRQGADDTHAPALPAPHLRPSLLKLAAQAMTERARRRSRRTRSVSSSDSTRFRRQSVPSLLPISLLTKPPFIESVSSGNSNFRSSFLVPRFRAALKHARGQTQTQKFRDIATSPIRTSQKIDSTSRCRGYTHAILSANIATNCKQFDACIPQHSHSELTRSFVCADKGYAFDNKRGKCVKREHIQCSAQTSPFSLSLEDAETFVVHTLGLCSFVHKGAFVIDSMNGCDQYIQCPENYHSPILVKRCPEGYLFSQKEQKCLFSDQVNCKEDIFSLMKLVQLKTSRDVENNAENNAINSIFGYPSLISRRRRALTFEDRNPHREISSGSLSNAAGIIDGHQVFVVEPQSPGNVVNTKIIMPKTLLEDPETHSESTLDKTQTNPLLFDTSRGFKGVDGIEVREFASPDQKGKVTITSVVPSIVRLNGNSGRETKRTATIPISSVNPTVITNGKTKITFVGSSGLSPTQETRLEEATIEEESGMDDSTATSIDISDDAKAVTEEVIPETESLTEEPSSDIPETTTPQILEEIIEEEEIGSVQETLQTEEPTEEITEVSTSTTKMVKTSTQSTTPSTTSTTSTTTTTTSTTTSTTTQSTTIAQLQTQPSAETNFTCKDKELDHFYPDIEKNCRLFHYCSPGFSADEVLDLTFVCSGDTRFDIHTKKCQDMSTVVCGDGETTTASSPVSSSSTSTITSSTTATPPATTTSSTSTLSPKTTISTSTIVTTTTTPEITSTIDTEDGTTIIMEDVTTVDEMSTSENWDTKHTTEPEPTTITVIDEEDGTSTPEMETLQDETETSPTSEQTDFSSEPPVESTSETTSEDVFEQSSTLEASTTDALDNEITPTSETDSQQHTDTSEIDSLVSTTSPTSEPSLEDSKSSSVISSTDVTTDTELPDDNLNLITREETKEVSTSLSTENITSNLIVSTTDSSLRKDTDVTNNEFVTNGDAPP